MQRRLPLVSTLIAAPCDVPWDSMTGNDRQRHCGACKRDVFNLSAMTEAEAHAFLEAAKALPENEHAPCVSLFQRTDGTVLTADCPVGLSRRRRRAILTSSMPFGVAAIVALTALGGVLGLMNHPTAKLHEEEPPPVPTVLVPTTVNTQDRYYGVITPPEPSPERDLVGGRHVAGGIRAIPPQPTQPPKPPIHKKITQKPTPAPSATVATTPPRHPTSAEILTALAQEPNTF